MATAQRIRRLQAMGVTPYRLRQTAAPEAETAARVQPERPTSGGGHCAACVLVLPAGCAPRHLDLLGRAMRAFGADFARAARIEVEAGALSGPPPEARAYLAFGDAQARALGLALPAEVMARADVVLLDAPHELPQGAAKRRLWTAVGALRRRWRAAAERIDA